MPSEILSEELSWIWKAILLVIVLGTIVAAVSVYLTRNVDATASSESTVLTKILFSQCIAYSENIANSVRYYPGIIDISKFENLKNCLNSEIIGTNITIYDLKNNLVRNIIINEKLFNDLKLLLELHCYPTPILGHLKKMRLLK